MYSTWEISYALAGLRVSHSIAAEEQTKADHVIALGFPQPNWVHVSPDPRRIKVDSHNFICAPFSLLKLTNIPQFPKIELELGLRTMLQSRVVTEVRMKRISALEYVDQVAKPSLLNKIQTEIYKIQPYSLRKDTQRLMLQFFNSKVSERTALHALRRSYKTEGLIPYVKGGHNLRAAVARLKYETVEAVAADTDLPTFELLYLSRANDS